MLYPTELRAQCRLTAAPGSAGARTMGPLPVAVNHFRPSRAIRPLRAALLISLHFAGQQPLPAEISVFVSFFIERFRAQQLAQRFSAL